MVGCNQFYKVNAVITLLSPIKTLINLKNDQQKPKYHIKKECVMLFSPTTLYSIIQNSPVETILSFVRDEILGDEDFRVDRSRGASGSCFGLTLRSMGVSSDWTAD